MSNYRAIAAELIASHGWISADGGRAEKRMPSGFVSLGTDCSLVLFHSYHPLGYPIGPVALGSVDSAAAADRISAEL